MKPMVQTMYDFGRVVILIGVFIKAVALAVYSSYRVWWMGDYAGSALYSGMAMVLVMLALIFIEVVQQGEKKKEDK